MSEEDQLTKQSEKFFYKILGRPWILIFVGFMLFFLSAISIPKITQDTSVDSFLSSSDVIRLQRDAIKEAFGLDDPMVIIVTNNEGVFNPLSLNLVKWLSEEAGEIEGIDPERITSIATEKNIKGVDGGMDVNPFYEDDIQNQEEADVVKKAILDFPLFMGSLVGKDLTTTLIVLETMEGADQAKVYHELIQLTKKAPASAKNHIHIAGEGAVTGFLGEYIAADAIRLNPIAGLIMTIILVFCFLTLRGTLLPNILIVGAVGSTLGLMGLFGVPFYPITSALPGLLIAICIADGIHIFSAYYEYVPVYPNHSQKFIVSKALGQMWRAVTLTSVTDIVGLLAISATTNMPPMMYFGIFASYGVFVAWFLSLTIVPGILVKLNKKPSRLFKDGPKKGLNSFFSNLLKSFGKRVYNHEKLVLAISFVVILVSLTGILQIKVNDERINNFDINEPIYKADKIINSSTDGSHFIDIKISTTITEGLFEPENLRRIESLQKYAKSLPNVNGNTSIVDYIKQMNKSLNEGREEYYKIPQSADLVAQSFLLYSTGSSPTDFEEIADSDYREGILRIRMNTQNYAVISSVLEKLKYYIDTEFTSKSISAIVSGAVKIHHHWLNSLAQNHPLSILAALIAILIVCTITFKSFTAGIFSVVPVMLGVFSIYAVMGFTGITLSIGTSMFAAISLGVGVDFAIHSIDKFVMSIRENSLPLAEAFETFYESTVRALLFTYLCLALGFGILLTSKVIPLQMFGLLMVVSTSATFLATITVLPALIKVFKPKFLFANNSK